MATPPFLLRLMAYTPFGGRLGPEDAMAVGFANALRAATLEGRLRAVWTHPANELAGVMVPSKGGKRTFRTTPQAAMAKAQGLITGSSDYLFLWPTGSAALEAKSGKGSLSEGQRHFRDWCAHVGVPFFIFRTEEQGLAILAELGVLDRQRIAA